MVSNPINRSSAALRALAVLALGALAVHQLRYLFGYGAEAGAALSHQGHGYLTGAVPVLLALALAAVLSSVLAGRFGAPARSRPRSAARVLAYAAALLATYLVQETSEGLIAAGHPGGLEGLLGNGGLIVVPLSLLVGLLAWAAAQGLEAVERRLASARVPPRPKAPATIGAPRPRGARPLPSSPLAFGLSRRPPPRLTI